MQKRRSLWPSLGRPQRVDAWQWPKWCLYPHPEPNLPGCQVPPVPFGNYRAIGFPLDNNMINNGVQVPTQVAGDGTWACGDNTISPATGVTTNNSNSVTVTLGPTGG